MNPTDSLLVLEKPEWEFTGTFSWVSEFVAVDDSLLFVTDETENRISFINPRTQTQRFVGRRGQGPGEYTTIREAVRFDDGIVLARDQNTGRLVLIAPNGIADVTRRADGTVVAASKPRTTLHGADRDGGLYYELRPAADAVVEGPPEDPYHSAPIVREQLRTAQIDTVAFARQRITSRMQQTSDGARRTFVSTSVRPFVASDIWALDSEGSVVIVRAPDYTVEWIARDGSHRIGQPISYEHIAPSAAIKNRSIEHNRRNGAPAPVFPAAIRPFMFEAFAANGTVWVQLPDSNAQPSRLFDVIDTTGARVRRVRIPEGTRLVGVGGAYAYLVREDSVGFIRLSRYRISR